jgi:L-lactate dehydrogenase complex protein LldE
MSQNPSPTVALFVTCLVDLFRPSVGLAALKLLEDAGCRVEVPRGQTCCGQPAYNQGARADAAGIARLTIEALGGYDYVVVPSGSCAGMLRKHYPELFPDGTPEAEGARALAARTFELTSFLTDVLGVSALDAAFPATATYHDSCSGLRELGVKQQPRRLLAGVRGLELRDLPGADVCCGARRRPRRPWS